MRDMYDRMAKDRQVAAGKEFGRGIKKVPEKIPEPIIDTADARDKAGGVWWGIR